MYTHAHVHAQALELLGLPEFVDVFDSSLADIMPTDAAAQQDWCVHYEYSYASHAAAITNCEVCAAHILTCIAGTLARCPPPPCFSCGLLGLLLRLHGCGTHMQQAAVLGAPTWCMHLVHLQHSALAHVLTSCAIPYAKDGPSPGLVVHGSFTIQCPHLPRFATTCTHTHRGHERRLPAPMRRMLVRRHTHELSISL